MQSASYILKKILFYTLVLGLVASAGFPFYYAIVTSFETQSALFNVSYFPTSFNISNYVAIFSDAAFMQSILNSAIVATATVALSLLLAVTASYALARIHFKGKSTLLLAILAVSMFPQIAVLAGLFELIRNLGLYNSLYALILSYLIFILPFTVWVLTTFMRSIPTEIEEAAIIDGASTRIIITRIFVPLLLPALVTTGLLAFIFAWNEFLFALTFTIEDSQRTVPVAIALLGGTSQYEIPWGLIMAGSVIVTVPLVIMVLIFQSRIVSGLTAGSVKG